MAKRTRGTTTASSKKTSMNGRCVNKKTKINKTEITDSIEKNTFLDFSIQQKYNLTDVHDSFLDVCFKDKCKMALIDGPAGSAKTYLSVYRASITSHTKNRRDSIHP